MAIVVQKYGGTSVGSVERIQAVAKRIITTVAEGNQVVVVVSAMGKTTDTLVQLAQEISTNPSRREMDMLLSTGEQVSIALMSMALQELGQPARSMTGAQVGIVTEAHHTRARILEIKTDRLQKALTQGEVVVVAGFQGIANQEELEITTLGRGGSDTSAVALAAALKADHCEIYTDVPGILTADPRLVPEARLMSEITCNEMLELASLGAKVLHPRAVEIARNYGIPLVVRSSWTDEPGTWVISCKPKPRPLEGLEIARPVDGIEFDPDQAKVALLHIPDCPGIAAKLFGAIAQQQLNIDLIIQSIHEGNTNDIAFTVSKLSLEAAEAVTRAMLPILEGSAISAGEKPAVISDRAIAKVSIEGAGMIGRPGVAAQMFQALANAGVNIQMISTSEVKVSCVIDSADSDRALAALEGTFGMNSEFGSSSARQVESDNSDRGASPKEKFQIPNSICGASPNSEFQTPNSEFQTPNSEFRIPNSEFQTPAVRGVALDRGQAQLTIYRVPDRPGKAAQIFGLLAEHQVSVDMIIQSQRCHQVQEGEARDIVCTVARGDADLAKQLLEEAAGELGCGEIVVNPAIAKVSAVGSGMVNQSGVAARMFAALGDRQINIQMIATSEIKISCLVDEAQAIEALQAVHTAFGLGDPESD
jgi:aspartate kinase